MRRQDIPIEHLVCIMQAKHAMVSFIPAAGEYDGPDWGKTFHLRCTNCLAQRHVTIDSLGNISTQHYILTEAYKEAREAMKGDLTRPDCAETRVEYMKRVKRERTAATRNGGRKRNGNGNGHR